MDLTDKRILVFGGGFIGGNLIHLLAQNRAEVICFDHKKMEWNPHGIRHIVGDFFDFEQVREALTQADMVVHTISTIAPGSSRLQYMQGYERDFMASLHMLDEAAKRGLRVLFLSSGGTVYGESKWKRIPEEAPLNPINHYGCVKVCIEQVMRQFVREGADFRIARISNAYGPGQNYLGGVGFIDAAVKCALAGRPVQIWGNGENVRDYIYIDDICQILMRYLQYEGTESIVNVGTGIGTTQNEVVSLLKERFSNIQVEYLDRRDVDVTGNVLDPSLCERLFGVKTLPLRDGIIRCVNAMTADKK